MILVATSSLLVLITFLLSIYVLKDRIIVKRRQQTEKKGLWNQRKFFPGPIHLPFIGAMLSFAYIKLRAWNLPHYERAHLLCKMYGKTCTGWAGGLSMLLTEDWHIAKEIYHSPDFGSRVTSHPRFHEVTFGKNVGLFLSKEEPWKDARRYTIKTLRLFGFGEVKATEAFIDQELLHFVERLEQDRERNQDEICMRKYFKVSLVNCIWKFMSGTRFEYSDPKIHAIVEDVESATKMEIGFDIEWVFPCLRYVPGFAHCWKACQSILRVQDFLRGIMDERRATGQYKEDPPTNFIDHFLQKLDQERQNPDTTFTDEQFIVTCYDLLAASIDTTSNAAEFTILHLLRTPRVLAKLQAEIDAIIGPDRVPTHEDFKRMPYAKAVQLETFRHANILPIMGRANTCDTIVDGHFVPRDVLVGINVAAINKDPEIWGEDAESFRPERFLDDQMNIINEDKLLAFGEGKHACIGTLMAKVMLFKFIATVLQGYELSPSPTHPELSLKTETGLTNATVPFYCMMRPRKIPATLQIGRGHAQGKGAGILNWFPEPSFQHTRGRSEQHSIS